MIHKQLKQENVNNNQRKVIEIADHINIFKEINLFDIFTNEEIDKLYDEPGFSHMKVIEEMEDENCNEAKASNTQYNKGFEENKNPKYESMMFDTMGLILKLLNTSIDKLNKYHEKTIAKGLEWVKGQIQHSVIVKTDEKSLKHLEKLREGNTDINLVLNWVEEYSTMNSNNKNMLETIKKKNYLSTKAPNNNTPSKNPYLSNYFSNDKIDKFQFNSNNDNYNSVNNLKLNYNTNSSNINYLNYSEESICDIEEPSFDIFKLDKAVGQENTLSTISSYIFITMGLYSFINYSNFENFVDLITKGYGRKNPYHTDLHAADVEQTCYIFLKYGDIKENLNLNDFDCASLLISAIMHDFKHPGLNNNYMINSKNEISIRYNDISVLENYHVSESFKIINFSPNCNIFSELSKDEYKIMRKRIIECVLATDMTLHNKEFSYMKIKLETFNIKNGKNIEKIFDNLDNIGIFNTQQEFLNTLIHTADISNPTKPLHIYEIWAGLVMEEFWNQGDKEKEMGLTVSFLCDRASTNVAAAQLGFMDGIVFPLIQVVVNFFPGLQFLIDNINDNKIHYKKIKEEQEKKENLNKKV